MTLDVLTKDKIIVKDQVDSWEEAIESAAQPLLTQKYIESSYIDSMIQSVKTLGPYIVIAPHVAIAHARPGNDVHQVGLSLLKLDEAINFSTDSHYAELVFVLSATDSTSHLTVLQNLAQLLGQQENIEALLEASNEEEIINIIKGVD
ncbi:PTS ascorbate transporter subunit IIA [Staphylococcus chromogenes]|uniref:Ascorbate-specific PTS system EIIA component n=1 Tax=Staphylococcus chromogenes TaxID=46126 RepID=A0AAX0ZF38_STACR|nr:PTS sugar transporter subunit IIA [Staphylococcus chromogenes]KDP12279.1 PTS system transporter subunit IIA [Staphylococcus chromogenes MU 970]MBV5138178.1 PTS sugar transporter subunit IIA [Staphylococcus chromogenes]MBW6089196.1 PTS sugar transporter subunit IIA [Staphylococcus chromogenes]MCD9059944.1 PTS sugar transporter subunit IIA [Staphylococcus chromogenes]MCD9062197.1 PTS sugar transporter subunit IIA [Staphylococcus chromogenes]